MPQRVVEEIVEQVEVTNDWDEDDMEIDPREGWRPDYDLRQVRPVESWVDGVGPYRVFWRGDIAWGTWRDWKRRHDWREVPVAVACAFDVALHWEPWPLDIKSPAISAWVER